MITGCNYSFRMSIPLTKLTPYILNVHNLIEGGNYSTIVTATNHVGFSAPFITSFTSESSFELILSIYIPIYVCIYYVNSVSTDKYIRINTVNIYVNVIHVGTSPSYTYPTATSITATVAGSLGGITFGMILGLLISVFIFVCHQRHLCGAKCELDISLIVQPI